MVWHPTSGTPAPVKRPETAIWFTPTAWSKYVFLRDIKPNLEVGAFGLSHSERYPLLLTDLIVPKQEVSGGGVDFDTDHMAELMIELADRDIEPWQWSRIWLHTHPFQSATPSGIDETNVREQMDSQDWAAMIILAQSDKTYARLWFNRPFPVEQEVNIRIAWKVAYSAPDFDGWKVEYEERVEKTPTVIINSGGSSAEGKVRQVYHPDSKNNLLPLAQDTPDAKWKPGRYLDRQGKLREKNGRFVKTKTNKPQDGDSTGETSDAPFEEVTPEMADWLQSNGGQEVNSEEVDDGITEFYDANGSIFRCTADGEIISGP